MLDEDGDDDEGWSAFWGPADFHCLAAEARMALGAHAVAEREQRAALDAADPAYSRNEALYLIRLADSLVAQGEIEEGATFAGRALDRLPQLSSGRLRRYVRALRPKMAAHASTPSAETYVHRLTEMLT